MKQYYEIHQDYLHIPVCCGQAPELVTISLAGQKTDEKKFEFMIPVDRQQQNGYEGDFLAEIPIGSYIGQTLVIEADAPEAFFCGISNGRKQIYPAIRRPGIHFTAARGWINDPNGLVYKDGIYHLYFQTNPVGLKWSNMSWGHAVSRDLLHWEQQDLVMLADEDGEMFSGCGLKNDRELLGLPKDALLFFYTAAGGFVNWSREKVFTQKIAYSLDQGKTLHKIKEPCIPGIYRENRDPAVFWHAETDGYVMTLYLREDTFGIFRSQDLWHWEMQQELTLEGGFECPGLFQLNDENGKKKWFFWAADGRYYPGEFDGFRFTPDGEENHAYLTGLPYAAQIYSGIEGRVISVPWLRIPGDGRLFTGAMGIPAEFTFEAASDTFRILQRPVREFYDQLSPVDGEELARDGGGITYRAADDILALYGRVEIGPDDENGFSCFMNGSEICYQPGTGELWIDGVCTRVGKNRREAEFILDDRILEIYFDRGAAVGTFLLKETEIALHAEKNRMTICELMVIRKEAKDSDR